MANLEVILKDNDNVLYPQGMLNGIDVNNVLASGVINASTPLDYLATQDGFISIEYLANNYEFTLSIDGVSFSIFKGQNTRATYPIKKGQRVRASISNGTNNYYKYYGIKH